MSVNGYKCTALTGGGAGALDAIAAAGLSDGDLAIVMAGGSLYHYELDADSGLVESSPAVIRPDDELGGKRWVLRRVPQTNSIPVGVVVPYMRGYMTNGVNGAFLSAYDTIASVNALLNPDGWYACDGAALNLATSPSDMFNGSNRYLPNLTDNRFIMGSSYAGHTGGHNAMSHTHAVDIGSFASAGTALTLEQIPSHRHPSSAWSGSSGDMNYKFDLGAADATVYTGYAGGSGGITQAHSHQVDPPATNTGGATNTENRPAYLAAIYIIKVAAS